MLDYIQQRGEFNRNSSTDRRRDERRSAERRGSERRTLGRRSDLSSAANAPVEQERRREERRVGSRRESERRNLERRATERRRDPSRTRRFPDADAGFLTPEERDFLQSVIRHPGDR